MISPPRALAALSLLLLAVACEPKPIAGLEALSRGTKDVVQVDDRPMPGGKTIAATLSLLDPSLRDPKALDARRIEFEEAIGALVPDPEQRKRLGLQRLVQWHKLYTQHLTQHESDLAAHERRLRELLKPPRSAWLEVLDNGNARLCEKAPPPPPPAPETDDAAEPKKGKKAKTAEPAPCPPPPPEPVCKPVPGLGTVFDDLDHIARSVRSLTESQWYLLSHLARLRATLDPGAPGDLPSDPEATPRGR